MEMLGNPNTISPQPISLGLFLKKNTVIIVKDTRSSSTTTGLQSHS
jgi:hypothetical protein